MNDLYRDESDERGDTASFLASVRDHGVFIVVALCLAAAAAFAYLVLAPKRYEAEADVLVTPLSADNEALSGLGLLTDPAGSTFTVARLLERPQVTSRVEQQLGLNIPRRELLSKIKITPLPQSDLVTILATDSSPEDAKVLANTFADELIVERSELFQGRLKDAITDLQRQVNDQPRTATPPTVTGTDPAQLLLERLGTMKSFQGQEDPTLRVWSEATRPDTPRPRSILTLVVIFVAAAFLAGGIGLGLEFVSPRIRRRSTLPAGWRLLAAVPSVRRGALVEALARDGQLPERFWDAWRLVRSHVVTTIGGGDRPVIVSVTSPSRREGKSQAAACLAVTFAASGTNVLLVDANLRDPQIATLFGIAARPGVAEVLEGQVGLEDALVSVGGMPGLRVLPAGIDALQAVDLLEPAAVAELLDSARREGKVVIVDGPGLAGSAEAVAIAAAADVVVVCAQSAQTRVEKMKELAAILGRLKVPVLGVVLRERQRGRGKRVTAPRLRSQPATEARRLRSEVA
jgi:Mrp family chromosome partitioning ATPase/capsular polysaccharide biosynthesis protein